MLRCADEKENDERGSRPASAGEGDSSGGGAAPGAAPADDKGKGRALVEEGEEGQQEEEEGVSHAGHAVLRGSRHDMLQSVRQLGGADQRQQPPNCSACDQLLARYSCTPTVAHPLSML